MAHTYLEQERTLPAAGDLTLVQYCFVKVNSDGRAEVAGDGGADAFGVLTNKPAAIDREARVVWGGTTKVRAIATIAPGDRISCDAAGKATAVGTGDVGLGTAIDGGTTGALISVQLGILAQ